MTQISISANIPDAIVHFIESASKTVDKARKDSTVMLEISYVASLAASTYTVLTGDYVSFPNLVLSGIAYASLVRSVFRKQQENSARPAFEQFNPREKKLHIASYLNLATNLILGRVGETPLLNAAATAINALIVADAKVSKQS